MKIFITADTHFNHENIIKYCNRPFQNASQMNEVIIKNWNKIVGTNDIVYHLGDFGFGSKEELKEIFNKLNGKKYLIMGNHDLRVGKNYFLDLGFENVYKKELKINNLVLSHYPKKTINAQINLFGHIHNKKVSEEFDDENHYCVCLDVHDFKPVKLDEIVGENNGIYYR